MTLYKRERLGFLLVLIEMRHCFLKLFSLERVKLKSINVVNLWNKTSGKMFTFHEFSEVKQLLLLIWPSFGKNGAEPVTCIRIGSRHFSGGNCL